MLCTALVAGAEEEKLLEETDDLPAVQNREYRTLHEFHASVGTIPADPYTKGLTLGGGYAWHVNDLWAVEGHYSWVFNFSSSLRDKLEGNFAIPSTRFDKFKMFGKLGTLFKPLYGKLAWLNDSQVYGEFYLSLYAAVAQLEGGERTDDYPQGKPERLAFGGSPGFGIRGYINRYLSARLDVSWLLLVAETGEFHWPLFLNLSFGLTTRSDL